MPDPSATYTSDDIVAAIKSGLGAEPLVHCERGMVTEVRLCASHGGMLVAMSSMLTRSEVNFCRHDNPAARLGLACRTEQLPCFLCVLQTPDGAAQSLITTLSGSNCGLF